MNPGIKLSFSSLVSISMAPLSNRESSTVVDSAFAPSVSLTNTFLEMKSSIKAISGGVTVWNIENTTGSDIVRESVIV